MPEEGFYFLTHTPAQAKKWKDLCASDPERVARVLRLKHDDPPTSDGDNQRDVFPAIEALREISGGRAPDSPDPLWAPLVDSGVVEALCECVIVLITQLSPLPTLPEILRRKAANDTPSPYQSPLMILCSASIRFSQPPTPHDKHTIAALKSRWNDMMDRLWDDPQNSLRPEGSHVLERVVVAQLLVRLIITDPTFLMVIYSDTTIPVIARHWAHATDENCTDARIPAACLHILFSPSHPVLVEYVNSHPQPPSKLLSGILLGVGPLPTSTKPTQVSALLKVFSKHLENFKPRGAYMELELLRDILLQGDEEPIRGAIKCDTLWRSMINLMKRSHGETEGDISGAQVIRSCMFIISHTINIASGGDREQLVRVCVEAGLFDVLDLVASELVALEPREEACISLTRIFLATQLMMTNASGPLKQLICEQFPRPRTLGTLVKNDMTFQNSKQELASRTGKEVEPLPTFIQMCWQMFTSLQVSCTDKGQCGRRGCEKRGAARCGTCKETLYCGQECQKADWKDHKVLCLVSGLVKMAETEAETVVQFLAEQVGDYVPF